MTGFSSEQMVNQFYKMERSQLEKMMFEFAISHIQLCEITDAGSASNNHHQSHDHKEGIHQKHQHASEQEIKKRIELMDTNSLIQILSSIASIQCSNK